MNNYVLVRDEHNILCPRPYMGNVLLIHYNGDSYRHYLAECGNSLYELFNTNPDESVQPKKVRCPKCSSQLVHLMDNKYQCVICKGI
jgi:DNA-directed RNA polymerase subunit RPC12/RpoP